MKERPSWDEYFMNMAELACERSTCLRRQVGAVLVRNNQILATGYNGSPKGVGHCADSPTGCMREKLKIPSGERHELCMAVHAEQNAIIQAAYIGVSTKGATLYTTTYPCSICAKMIINAGISKVIYEGEYPDTTSKSLFGKAEIPVRKFNRHE